ncbi:MAG: type II toxin-antitoxin system RelE/ParE family toxin [Deltaproteobacteria bacterium]|nr:type II toxin-antitoxin system RelE/ParE family toxin [Deltaproteobacteria bacterium]
MIRSFKCKDAERIFNRRFTKKISRALHRVTLRKLRMLNRANSLQDLQLPPGNRLEVLLGNRKGQHGIRINKQWRICFRWHENDAFDVEIADYH